MFKGFQEFPKWMNHPHHEAAIPYRQPRYRPGEEGWGKPVDSGNTGKPEKFPNVMVNNKDQEMQYAALGYVPAGVADPESYRLAMTGNDPKPIEEFIEFPRMLYRKAAVVKNGQDLEMKIVNDQREKLQYLKDGWYLTPSEARQMQDENKVPQVVEKRQATELAPAVSKKPKEKKAKHHRWSKEAKQKAAERAKKFWADKKAIQTQT